jgi:ubiquitin-protein ligase
MTSADYEIERFFAKAHHCTPQVLQRIKADIVDLMHTLRLSIRSTVWGDTSQHKLCVYGGIPIGSKADYLIPIQIWMTNQYPIDPPVIYVVPSCDEKVLSNSKMVDGTGLCYCPNLSQWKPSSSTLRHVVIQIAKQFQTFPPLWIDDTSTDGAAPSSAYTTGGAEGSDDKDCVICLCVLKDTVLVPCGHFCVCSSCAANVSNCPMCRTVIQFRQKVFL